MTAGADLRLLRAAVFTVACVALSMAGHTLAAGSVLPLWTIGAACAMVFAAAARLAGRERSLPGITAALALGQVALHTLFSFGMHGTAAHSGGVGANAHGGGGGSGLKALAGQLLCNDSAAAALTEAKAREVVSDAGLSTAHTAYAPDLAHGGHSGHGGHGLSETAVDCLRAAVTDALQQLTPAMLLGHLLAAIAAGLLLRRGEAALWRLVRLSVTAATAAEKLVTVRDLRTALSYVRALRAGLLADAPAPRRVFRAHDEIVPRPVLLHHTVSRRGPPRAAEGLALAA
ncbi:hypothetical protein LHJ74_05205 [Streptomyces sp. N2-109]|uniref:Integral membrane protein n=1 Tax=Streptomyces gossypii TaxID=2883101 RepID=A0ABT2JN82_9ACTN|nr:hypothetical protein [Streptomyces gossypii]MCT2589337.1 hypothetical protein [Streptomyces gossypii]